jgi:protein TonB
MFDLITQKTERPFREPALLPRILSMTLHVAVLLVVVAIPLLTVTNTLPEAPSILAFVADGAAPPPPPPPPAPRAAAKPTTAQPAPSVNASAAPLEAPTDIRPEPPVASTVSTSTGGAGGVEGGVEGGVVGGIVGGMVGVVTPPPPPPPPAQAPVRIGGQIKTPALLHRVEPAYPDIAAAAHLTGLVILEAVVDTMGCVESVKVLRSGHPLLDREAVAALKQWRYTPLMLNGTATPFVLTVTFNFNVAH